MASDASTPDEPRSATVNVKLTIAGHQLETQLTVSTAPMRPRQLLPLLQSITNAVVEIAVEETRQRGQTISCKAGCGACCRQIVPITYSEARQLRELVAALPPERQAVLRQRFTNAVEHFRAAGLLDEVARANRMNAEERHHLGMRYLAERVACPFLEDESCSIHPQRPVSCREYLVTSPAENCGADAPPHARVEVVPLPLRVWNTAVDLDREALGSEHYPWLPLVLAMDVTEECLGDPAARPGPELVAALFRRLTGKDLPTQPTPAPGS